jgi:hypothetical protein
MLRRLVSAGAGTTRLAGNPLRHCHAAIPPLPRTQRLGVSHAGSHLTARSLGSVSPRGAIQSPAIPTKASSTQHSDSKSTHFEDLCRLLINARETLSAAADELDVGRVESNLAALDKRLHVGFRVAQKYALVKSQARMGVLSATEREAMLVRVVGLREMLVALHARLATRRVKRGALSQIYRLALDLELQLACARTATASAQIAALCRIEAAFRADLIRAALKKAVLLDAHGDAFNLLLDALQRHAATVPLVVQLGRDFITRQTTRQQSAVAATTIALLMRAHLRARRELDAGALDELAALPVLRSNPHASTAVRVNLILPWVTTVCEQAHQAHQAGVAAAACRSFRREGLRRLLVALSALHTRARWLDDEQVSVYQYLLPPSASVSSSPSEHRYHMSAEPIAAALAGHGDRCTLTEVLEPWMRAHGIASTPRHAELVAGAALARARTD